MSDTLKEEKQTLATTDVQVLLKELREKHFLDISVSPMFEKQTKKGEKKTNTGFSSRSYTYMIIESDGDKYRPVDNGHHPWPIFKTYEAAEIDAVSVALAYKKNKTDGK